MQNLIDRLKCCIWTHSCTSITLGISLITCRGAQLGCIGIYPDAPSWLL
jgi:hypothetical protein